MSDKGRTSAHHGEASPHGEESFVPPHGQGSPSLRALSETLASVPPRCTDEQTEQAALLAFLKTPPLPWWRRPLPLLPIPRWSLAPAALAMLLLVVLRLGTVPAPVSDPIPVAVVPAPEPSVLPEPEPRTEPSILAGKRLEAAPSLPVALPGNHELHVLSGSVQVAAASEHETVLDLSDGTVDCSVSPLSGSASFQVHTPDALVSVVGTHFQVRREGARTHVSVQHGRVRVERPGHPDEVRFLNAGESLGVEASGFIPTTATALVSPPVQNPPRVKPSAVPAAPETPTSAERLRTAREALRENRLNEAESVLTGLLFADESGTEAAQALYLLGETKVAQRRRIEALRHFVKAVRHPRQNPTLRDSARKQVRNLLETFLQTGTALPEALREPSCTAAFPKAQLLKQRTPCGTFAAGDRNNPNSHTDSNVFLRLPKEDKLPRHLWRGLRP